MSEDGFKSALVQKGRLLPGIHGLRGVAALAIVLFHLKHIGGMMPPEIFSFIGRDFGYSVHLFFIVSAFSLMYSTEPHLNRPNWLVDYFIKRFFRIAPLFYTIITFELLRQAYYGHVIVDLNTILLNYTFTFGFVPMSGFVWGGWSVGVEMIFYALFPVLILSIKNYKSALLFLIIMLVTSYSIRAALHIQHINTTPRQAWDWSYFAFQSNVAFFAMGIFAYRVESLINKDSIMSRAVIPLAAITVIGGLMFSNLGSYLYGEGRLDILLWGFGLTLLCVWQSISPSLIIANKLFEYLGERSFSIYLVHPIVISFSKKGLSGIYANLEPYIDAYSYFACAILVVAVILLVAELTYRLIEVPGIELGRHLIARGRV